MTIAEQLEVMFRNKGRAEGLAEGFAEGHVEGQRLLIEKQLVAKFGPLPSGVKERLERSELAQLEAMAERVLRAASLEEAFEA